MNNYSVRPTNYLYSSAAGEQPQASMQEILREQMEIINQMRNRYLLNLQPLQLESPPVLLPALIRPAPSLRGCPPPIPSPQRAPLYPRLRSLREQMAEPTPPFSSPRGFSPPRYRHD